MIILAGGGRGNWFCLEVGKSKIHRGGWKEGKKKEKKRELLKRRDDRERKMVPCLKVGWRLSMAHLPPTTDKSTQNTHLTHVDNLFPYPHSETIILICSPIKYHFWDTLITNPFKFQESCALSILITFNYPGVIGQQNITHILNLVITSKKWGPWYYI